jgi:hypothetical protein
MALTEIRLGSIAIQAMTIGSWMKAPRNVEFVLIKRRTLE